MGANVGIASLIGTIVLVVIGLMMLGLVEDGVTDALTESQTLTIDNHQWRRSQRDRHVRCWGAGPGTAAKVVDGIKSAPPGFSVQATASLRKPRSPVIPNECSYSDNGMQ